MHPFGVVDLHKSHNLYTQVSFLRTRGDTLGNRFFFKFHSLHVQLVAHKL